MKQTKHKYGRNSLVTLSKNLCISLSIIHISHTSSVNIFDYCGTIFHRIQDRKYFYYKKDFYQTTKTDYIDLSKVNLKPTYEYYINLKTSTQSYVFTNFFVSQASQAITVKVFLFLKS